MQIFRDEPPAAIDNSGDGGERAEAALQSLRTEDAIKEIIKKRGLRQHKVKRTVPAPAVLWERIDGVYQEWRMNSVAASSATDAVHAATKKHALNG